MQEVALFHSIHDRLKADHARLDCESAGALGAKSPEARVVVVLKEPEPVLKDRLASQQPRV